MTLDFNLYILLATKIMAVFGSLLYFIFAVVIVKQVGMMTKNVSDVFNSILITFSYIHLIFAILLILLILVIL